jgi:hypothetical protein
LNEETKELDEYEYEI